MSKQDLVWNLKDLYRSLKDPKIKADIKKVKTLSKSLQRRKKAFCSTGKLKKELLGMIKDYEKIQMLSLDLFAFFQLQYDIDSSDQTIKSNLELIKKILIEIEADLSFFEVEMSRLPKTMVSYIAKKKEFELYRHFIHKFFKLRKYTLSEKEERLLSLTSLAGSMAWDHFYSFLATTLDFGQITVNKKRVPANESILTSKLFNFNPAVREKAFRQLKGTYQKKLDEFTYTYNTLVTDYEQRLLKLRKYKTSLSARALHEEVSEDSIIKMLDFLDKNIGLFQEYYKVKKDKLGLKEFKVSDVLAPLYKTKERIPYKKAQKDILACLYNFDKEIAILTEAFFSKRWIHAEPGPRKYSGAYCFHTTKHPFLLANYQPKYNYVFTLVHELGHGVHYILALKKQAFLQSHASLVLAECASQFNELLLLDYYWENLGNKKVLENILVNQLDDMLNALFRQSLITQFEIDVHKANQKLGLTSDYLCQHWYDLSKNKFGKKVKMLDEEKFGWARISHIFQSPFYCFTYTMSMFVVLALYGLYKEDKKEFIIGYKKVLRAGRSNTPNKILKDSLGIDLEKKELYARGLEVIEELIQRLS